MTIAPAGHVWLLRRWWRLTGEEREKEFWTLQRAVRETGCSEAGLLNLIMVGKLPSICVVDRVYLHVPSMYELLCRINIKEHEVGRRATSHKL